MSTSNDTQGLGYTPATPAPIKGTPMILRHCAELGICQGYEPRCRVCENHTADDPENPDGQFSTAHEIAYWGSVIFTTLLTVVFGFGFAGFLVGKFAI